MEIAPLFNINSDLEKIYVRNFPTVRAYILQNSGTEEDAKDIYQEAFIAFWRNLKLERIAEKETGSLNAYLLSIAKYKWIDRLRKQKQNPFVKNELLLENLTDQSDEDTESGAYLDLVVAEFKKMKEPCKEVLYRFYYLKERLKSIANYFNWTEATAKNNKYRCLEKLRSEVLDNTKVWKP